MKPYTMIEVEIKIMPKFMQLQSSVLINLELHKVMWSLSVSDSVIITTLQSPLPEKSLFLLNYHPLLSSPPILKMWLLFRFDLVRKVITFKQENNSKR